MSLSKAVSTLAFATLALLFLAALLDAAFPGADRSVPAVDLHALPGIPEYDDRHPPLGDMPATRRPGVREVAKPGRND